MYRTQYHNRIPQNKCIRLNTVTVFHKTNVSDSIPQPYSTKQMYRTQYRNRIRQLFNKKTTNICIRLNYSNDKKNKCISDSNTVFHKKQEHMYWISTRTYVPDSIIPIKRKTNVSYSNTVFHKTNVSYSNTVFHKTNVSYSNTVFHKKTRLMYWISTRTYVPDSIIPRTTTRIKKMHLVTLTIFYPLMFLMTYSG